MTFVVLLAGIACRGNLCGYWCAGGCACGCFVGLNTFGCMYSLFFGCGFTVKVCCLFLDFVGGSSLCVAGLSFLLYCLFILEAVVAGVGEWFIWC